MTSDNKTKAKTVREKLSPCGGTQLWSGLECGLDVLKNKIGSSGKNASLFLLTDGEPSDKGHLALLEKYMDKNPLKCTINTFGFGYSLDSALLTSLAHQGNGVFAFIPDSSLVGTVFVNALTNVLVTSAVNATLSLEHQHSCKIEKLLGGHNNVSSSWGLTIPIGTLQYGQTKDFVVKLAKSKETKGCISATLKYISIANGQEVSINSESVPNQHIPELNIHLVRCSFLDGVQSALAIGLTDVKKAQDIVDKLAESLQKLCSQTGGDSLCTDILQDLTGQVTEAVSKAEWFKKWGRHYLPSLVDAHRQQMCNNFKDFGVQHYGGTLFHTIRDKIDEIFLSLPPPVPSKAKTSSSYSSSSSSSSYSQPSMSAYYNCGGG